MKLCIVGSRDVSRMVLFNMYKGTADMVLRIIFWTASKDFQFNFKIRGDLCWIPIGEYIFYVHAVYHYF